MRSFVKGLFNICSSVKISDQSLFAVTNSNQPRNYLKLRQHIWLSLPHSAIAGLDQPANDILESLRVVLLEFLGHFGIQSIGLSGLIVDPVLLRFQSFESLCDHLGHAHRPKQSRT